MATDDADVRVFRMIPTFLCQKCGYEASWWRHGDAEFKVMCYCGDFVFPLDSLPTIEGKRLATGAEDPPAPANPVR